MVCSRCVLTVQTHVSICKYSSAMCVNVCWLCKPGSGSSVLTLWKLTRREWKFKFFRAWSRYHLHECFVLFSFQCLVRLLTATKCVTIDESNCTRYALTSRHFVVRNFKFGCENLRGRVASCVEISVEFEFQVSFFRSTCSNAEKVQSPTAAR